MRYGWRPDTPDQRDYRLLAPRIVLPIKVDLSSMMPSIYDQDQLGSCVANAVGANLQYVQRLQNEAWFIPSRLFLYYEARRLEGSVEWDSGCEIRDGVKVARQLGGPREVLWPYEIDMFANKPPQTVYDDGQLHQAITYWRVARSITAFRTCLAQGFPIVIGFSVYEDFESDRVARTGVVNMPGRREELLGGHAVLVVGYRHNSKRWLVRNSWGRSWGWRGYFTMPYEYLMDADLSDDFWTIRKVE